MALRLVALALAKAPRLHLDVHLRPHAHLQLPKETTHLLRNVLRCSVGEPCRVFNGRDGEWGATIAELSKRGAVLELAAERLREPPPPDEPAPRLLFGVLKNRQLPLLVEKATELGVGTLQPVVTEHCAARSINIERLAAIATEAAEQSERLTVPAIEPPRPLTAVLEGWDAQSTLYVCDERSARDECARAPLTDLCASSSVLVGPEGGFSPSEFELLESSAFVRPISLGSNVLRAETACIAALAVIATRGQV